MMISVVVLTYQRELMAKKLTLHLLSLKNVDQIILVDNSGSHHLKKYVSDYKKVSYVLGDNNKGTLSRNLGIGKAVGDIIICLDDDVMGLSDNDIDTLENEFLNFSDIGAVCFKILDLEGKISNWSHHCLPSEFSEKKFKTYEISEGAVAFRKSTLDEVGLYAEGFFISHEGIDLALRIINSGYKIFYLPRVCVVHSHEDSGRKSWRRYYYDTRNLFIVWKRNFGISYGFRYAGKGALAMFVYSVRDGFLRYWFKGVVDGIWFFLFNKEYRVVVNGKTIEYIKTCEIHKPSFLYILKNRILRHGVRI